MADERHVTFGGSFKFDDSGLVKANKQIDELLKRGKSVSHMFDDVKGLKGFGSSISDAEKSLNGFDNKFDKFREKANKGIKAKIDFDDDQATRKLDHFKTMSEKIPENKHTKMSVDDNASSKFKDAYEASKKVPKIHETTLKAKNETQPAFTGFNKSVHSSKKHVSVFKSVLLGTFAGNIISNGFQAIVGGFKSATAAGMAYNKQQDTMKTVWTALTNEAPKDGKKLTNYINQVSQHSIYAAGTIDKMAQSFYHVHSNVKETQSWTKSFVALGSTLHMTDSNLQAAGTSFAKIVAGGKANSQDMSTMINQFPMFGEALQKSTGKSMKQLYAMSAAGKLSAKQFTEALDYLGKKYKGGTAEAMTSFQGMSMYIKSRWSVLTGGIMQSSFKLSKGVAHDMQDLMKDDMMKKYAHGVSSVVGGAISGISGLVKAVDRNKDSILAALGTIGHVIGDTFGVAKSEVKMFGVSFLANVDGPVNKSSLADRLGQFQKGFHNFAKAVSPVTDAIGGLSGALDAGIFNNVGSLFRGLAAGLGASSKNGQSLKGTFDGIAKAIYPVTNYFAVLGKHMEPVTRGIGELAGAIGKQVWQDFATIISTTSKVIGTVADGIGSIFGVKNGGALKALGDLLDSIAKNKVAVRTVSWALTGLLTTKMVTGGITGLFGSLAMLAGKSSALGGLFKTVSDSKGIVAVLKNVGKLPSAIGELGNGKIDQAISKFGTFKQILADLPSKLKQIPSQVTTKIKTITSGMGIKNQWKNSSKLGKVATVAVGVQAVYDASTDIAKGMKTKNPDKKLKAYGSATGETMGGAIGLALGGPLGAELGMQIGKIAGEKGGDMAHEFATGWSEYNKKHPLQMAKVKGGTAGQSGYEFKKGASGTVDNKQLNKEGVGGLFDPRMWANSWGALFRKVGGKSTKNNDKSTLGGFIKFQFQQIKWPKAPKWLSWLTTTQNPGKGNKPITMPKIKFPKIKLPNIWKWLTTDVKPKTKPIEAPKFKKIKWPSLPKWMNWKNWKWPKFKAPKMPRIKWPKMPNLAKPWKSETGKLSRNFNSWKKSFSKSWSKHWSSTRSTLSSDLSTMRKNTNSWGSRTNSWFNGFKKGFSKSWSRHWSSMRSALSSHWSDMRKNTSSWGSNTSKWLSSFSKSFSKGFRSMSSGIHNIWDGMWSGLHKLAHNGMKDVVGIINAGISGIDGVIHLFGGKEHAISKIHFATGTGMFSNQRRPINKLTHAVVNDGNDSPETGNKELIFRANGGVEYSKERNADQLLMPGDEVANAKESAMIAPMLGIDHFASGTGIFSKIGGAISGAVSGTVKTVSKGASWLKNLFSTASKIISHPIKSFEDLFKYTGGVTKGIFQQIGKGGFNNVAKAGKNWWSKLWSMVNLNGDGASGDATGLLSAVEKYGKGHKYVWGAAGPDSFDCSGLVKYSLEKAFGINYPHFSGSQYAETKHISKSDVQAGDLVFWGPGKHVGVYAGGDKYYSAFSPSAHPNIGMYSLAGSVPGYSPLFGAVKGLSHNKDKGKSSKASTKGIKGQVGSGFWKTISKIASMFGETVGNATDPSGDGVQRWKPDVKKALSSLHLSTSGSMVNRVLRQIATESGGNSKAMGGTDGLSDGRAMGLMQVKPGTFSAYGKSGLGGWSNGYASIYAGLNYAKHRYGSSLSFLGNGHGYANGGEPSVGVPALVGEKGAELIVPKQQSKVIPHGKSKTLLNNLKRSVDVHPTINMNITATDAEDIKKKAGDIAKSIIEKMFGDLTNGISDSVI